MKNMVSERLLPEARLGPDSLVLQHDSLVARVTGIEPALPAWETHTYVRAVLRGPCVTWCLMICIGPRLLHADCTLSAR